MIAVSELPSLVGAAVRLLAIGVPSTESVPSSVGVSVGSPIMSKVEVEKNVGD